MNEKKMYPAPLLGFAVGGAVWVGFAVYAYAVTVGQWYGRAKAVANVYTTVRDVVV